jgi:HPt (histidine-containing phosphotransfer) domain-containing protein
MFLDHSMPAGEAPTSFERPIDLVHLARQTLGDRDLEREILELFIVQARTVLQRLAAAGEAQARADLAHTLKGSARAVGAWRVAAQAEKCESAATSAGTCWLDAYRALSRQVEDVVGAISELRPAA